MTDFDRGSEQLTLDYSPNYAMVEKIARQMIRSVETNNPLAWVDKGMVDNGVAVEDAVLNLASSYGWVDNTQNGANVDAPSYPTFNVRYFKEWNGKQFKTTTADSQLRKVLRGDMSPVEISQRIVGNLTESENYEDYTAIKGLLEDGVTAGNIKPVVAEAVSVDANLITMIKDTVDDFQFVNKNYVGADYSIGTRTPFDRIHIVMPYKVYNKLNVDVLASLFNLEKAELLNKITLIDSGDKVFILDEFGVGRWTRLFRYTQRYVEDGLYLNSWLTVDRMYTSNPLFKMAYIPVSVGA